MLQDLLFPEISSPVEVLLSVSFSAQLIQKQGGHNEPRVVGLTHETVSVIRPLLHPEGPRGCICLPLCRWPAWRTGTMVITQAGALSCSPSGVPRLPVQQHVLPVLWIPTYHSQTLSQPSSSTISLKKPKVFMMRTGWSCSPKGLLKLQKRVKENLV